MAKWAVFDVDGTLFPPTSMEKKYLLYLLSQGYLPLRNILYYAFYALYTLLRHDWIEAFKNNKYYLKEIPATPIRENGAHFVNSQVWPEISKQGLQKIEKYRRLNYKILIMSGSPDFLTETLSAGLKPDYIITARMQTSNGVFTGKLNGLHPYGERKTRLLLAVSSKIALDFKKSIVFANHSSDIDHMKLFGTAVAVNPKPGLREYALKNNWAIEKW
jgi:HAD superfamily phosphoserine phosphatase-like hydrolase